MTAGRRAVHERVIRGGSVIDGSGAPAQRADVGIDAGRITAIGSGLSGADVLDASGCLVAPGFIDLHTHYDPQVLWDPALTPSSGLGVTSVVAGNCGFSLAPCAPASRNSMIATLVSVEEMAAGALRAGIDWTFETYGDYLAAVSARGTAINFGGYVGHTAVRMWVMGDDAYERAATPDEVQAMQGVVTESVRAGALGFSSDRSPFHRGDGGRRVPSAVAEPSEVTALIRAVDALGWGLVHVAPGEQYSWLYELAASLRVPITWSAILAYPPGAVSKAPWAGKLADHRAGVAGGADVHPQVTCRPVTMQISMADPTTFYMVPAFARVAAADRTERGAIYRDEDWLAEAAAQIDSGAYVDVRWDKCVVAETRNADLTGHSLAELGRAHSVHPLAAAVRAALDDDLTTRITVNFANDDPAAVEQLLVEPGCVLGLSDAGAHVGQICDAVMPLDFLAHWVRDRNLLSVEAGLRRLTGELADLIGLRGRGYLREGYAADVVVLDWERLTPGPVRRVADFPAGADRLVADAPEGLPHILVNGVPIRRNGRAEHSRPGQLLTNRPDRVSHARTPTVSSDVEVS